MKIRVLLVQETIGSGGVERRRLSLMKYLDHKKFEFKVVCTQIQGPLADEMKILGVEVISIGLFKRLFDLKKYLSVLKIINDFKPHIIHGAVFEGVILSTIAGTLGRVPIIIIEETSDPINRSKKASFFFRGLSLLADKIIGVSPSIYNYLNSLNGIRRAKVELIVNGVPPPAPISLSKICDLKSSYEIRDNDIVLGSAGRLNNFHKRFTDLVDTLEILRNKYPTLKILIIGDGPDKRLIEEYVKTKGLVDRVIMAGYQHDPHPFFEIMDIFAIVSHMEAFGLVAVEAMFHKLPVIATSVGGLKDVVLDQQTGYLVPRHEPEQIAQAIDKLLSDRDLIKIMGNAGYMRAQNEYGAERYVQDVEKLYDKLLQQKNILYIS